MQDMENLMSELRSRRFLDVFEYNGTRLMWACFLCNHPDRAHGFLQVGVLQATGMPIALSIGFRPKCSR